MSDDPGSLSAPNSCLSAPQFSIELQPKLSVAIALTDAYITDTYITDTYIMSTFSLYLIRHGLAGQFGDYADDALRPLTSEGVQKTRKVARRLREVGVQVDRLFTSPYLRAHQTAKILQEEGIGTDLEVLNCLAPEGSFAAWLEVLQAWQAVAKPIAIVGHEPDLSQAAERLIFGDIVNRFVLKKAGTIGLELPTTGNLVGKSTIFWLTSPRLLL
ncbi:phosphohistidine phosphatase SixA [Alkalinema pantanalense CENA528]|uniref:phosphohistidine phosphatase SixA n=1 Tax=Alkalinema pantanalense TaxID=1620705 RepID=UPI003D70232D